ncbi:MAG: right-handed parallel beta-helix repeat-containing protein, partial [Sedimentisphaerales bacterium]
MKSITHLAGKWLFAMIIITYPLHLATAGIIYVDANATGAKNGSSWTDAYTYLQNALNAAGSSDSIWVAQGTYKPDRNKSYPNGTGSRTATFQLKNGVALYGGFPSGGGNWSSRDPNIHQTILSGDLAGNDANVPDPCNLLTEPTRAENSYNVVTGSYTDATAILDGFTIEAGNANSSVWPDDVGGGMLNISSSCTVNNCTFVENSSGAEGGGMYNFEATCTVNNCTFIENSSGTTGGAMNNSQSDSHISNCTFLRNAAFYGGGGICSYLYLSNHPVVVNCSFISNKGFGAGNNAGGLYNIESSPEVNNCSFINNSAIYGGGVSNINSSYPIITNCTFSGNSALYYGGMNSYSSSSPTLTNCTFSGNSAQYGEGGLGSGNDCNVTLTDCTFSGNSAQYFGDIGTYNTGVIYLRGSSRIQGIGGMGINLGGEIVIDSNAVVDLNDPNDPNIKGTIQCDGLLDVKGNGQLKHATVNVSRQAGGY